MHFCFLLIFIKVQLPSNVVLASTVQQSEPAVCRHTSPHFWIPSHLGHHIALSGVPWATQWGGFLHNSAGEESTCNSGDPGSVPGLGRSPGEGNGSPLQYSCLKNTMDRGAWRATVCGVARVGHDWVTNPIYISHISVWSFQFNKVVPSKKWENNYKYCKYFPLWWHIAM